MRVVIRIFRQQETPQIGMILEGHRKEFMDFTFMPDSRRVDVADRGGASPCPQRTRKAMRERGS